MATTEKTFTTEDKTIDFPGILSAGLQIFDIRGPYEIDGQTYITDLCGFLALRGVGLNPHSTPVRDSNVEMSRSLLVLSADKTVSLTPLRDFLQERIDREADSGGCVECLVFGCQVDARVVKRWVDLIPATECKVALRHARCRQVELGQSLLLEGDGWKLVIAGVLPVLKFPPTYDAPALTTTEAQ